jgi:predicted dienelactone hydrolase
MIPRRYPDIAVIAVACLALGGFALILAGGAHAQSQYPIMDGIADKIVQKYQGATCEQLWERKSEHAPPSREEQRALEILRGDPQMRAVFIARIAPPIANKMFDCAMIP